MNKTEFISAVAEKAGITKKETEKVWNAAVETICEELKQDDGKVSFVGFGTFMTKDRAARSGRNPRTGVEVKIPASRAPVFKASAELKKAITK